MIENELIHYGVKGMKWGVRKKQKTANTKRRYKVRDYDKFIYGKKGAQRIADRMNRGVSRKSAVTREFAGQFAKGFLGTSAAIGGVYLLSTLKSNGKVAATFKKMVNAGKSVRDKYYNISVLDKDGSVIARFHDKVTVGEDIVKGLLGR